jgi:hypothetical protein
MPPAGNPEDRASGSVRYVPQADVLSRRVEDEVVLVNMRTNEIFALNQTGARLWELLLDGHDEGSSMDVLRSEFDVSDEALRSEVTSFFALLEGEGLIRKTDN